MKLREALDLFLGSYRKETTRDAYSRVLEPFVTAIGPERNLANITPVDVQDYLNDLADRPVRFQNHPRRPAQEGGLAPATLKKHTKSIKTFFNFLVDFEVLDRSPARKVKQKRLSQTIERERMATDEEVELILRACFGHIRNYALVLFIADTACRAGGVADLQLANLDLEQGMAFVIEKGDKKRPVWFGPTTQQALRRWLANRPLCDHNFVFCSTRKPYGKLLSLSVSNIVERAALSAGIERPIHSHHLRHWKADKLSQVTDVATTSLVLGHEDPMTTLAFYYHNDYRRAREAVQRLAYRPFVEIEADKQRVRSGSEN